MIPLASGAGGTAPSTTASLRYPYEQIGSDTDYVMFSFYEYRAPFSDQANQSVGGNLAQYNQVGGGQQSLGSPTGNVLMYMPEDIGVQYGAGWQDTNISNVAKGMLGGFGKAANGDLGGAVGKPLEAVGEATKNFFTQGTGIAKAISEALAMSNFGSLSVNDVYSITTGKILNPNTEVLYKGPKMRNFSLSFKMVPKNAPDAERIRQILHKFKYATLPSFGGGDAGNQISASFVKIPQIIDVTFLKGNSPHPYVTQFKPSVITNLDISYTPDGAWARLPNGSPVATTMSISFQEIKMVYREELSDNGPSF